MDSIINNCWDKYARWEANGFNKQTINCGRSCKDYTKNKKIKNILDKLIHCEMILFENNTYIIKNWKKYQSADKYEKALEQNRERQRRFRKNQKTKITLM